MVIYTLLYFKWINNLLYSTWNSAQCYMAAWMGRGVCGRMATCICMAESLLCSPETITTLLIDYTPKQNKKFKKKRLFTDMENSIPRAKAGNRGAGVLDKESIHLSRIAQV